MSTVAPSADVKALVSQLDLFSIDQGSCDSPTEEIERQQSSQAEMQRLKIQGNYRKAVVLEMDRLQAVYALYGKDDDRVLSCLESSTPVVITLATQLRRLDLLETSELGSIHSNPISSPDAAICRLASPGMRVFAEVVDPNDPEDVAVLAALFQRTGNLQTAAHLWQTAARIQVKQKGEDDIDAVRYTIKLAGVNLLRQRWTATQPALENALNVMRRFKGDHDPETLRVAQKLMRVYLHTERWDEVITLHQWIASWVAKFHGAGDVPMLESLVMSSSAYLALKKWKQASDASDQIMYRLKGVLPANDPALDTWKFTVDAMKVAAAGMLQRPPDDASKIYSALQSSTRQVRLVRVSKSTETGNLEANLVPASLTNAPPYEALSYVWGDMEDSRTLKVDGHSLNITRNLFQALQHLLRDGKDRLLWIDAICINQADLAERGAQVRLIKDIYANASRTVVWLGPASHESELAMKTLKDLEAHRAPAVIIRGLLSAGGARVFGAMHHLLVKREYWSRLWIVQEVVSARAITVQCGESQIGFSIMRDFSTLLKDVILQYKDYDTLRSCSFILDDFLPTGPNSMMPMGGGSGRDTLLRLLDQQRRCLCSDPRDRVYAVLGISDLSESRHPGLQIDYSAPMNKVYMGAARAVIEETESLDIICLASEPQADGTIPYRVRQPFLPSWVPDWNTGFGAQGLAITNGALNASPTRKASTSFAENRAELVAEGVALGHLKQLGPPIGRDAVGNGGREGLRILLNWRLLAQLAIGASPFSPSGILLPQFYSLLVHEQSHFVSYNESAAAWWAQWQRELMAARSVDAFKVSAAQHTYLEFVFNSCNGRRFFLLGRSAGSVVEPPPLKIGLASHAAAQGDILCVLFGCRFPVVLRRKEDHFVFVGEAYVPDYARGEAIQELDSGKRSSQHFRIR